jgi:hypothetical protein
MGFPMGLPPNGFPNQCPHGDFPMYVWLADNQENIISNYMTDHFDYWHNKTGEKLAFFLDPFVNDEWSRELLQSNNFSPVLIDELLLTCSALRPYFQDRISLNIAEHFRIGKEFLPIAIISLHWKAKSAIVCFIRTGEELGRLFDELIKKNIVKQDRFDFKKCLTKTRYLFFELKKNFDARVYDFPDDFVDELNTIFDPKSIGKFLHEKRNESTNPTRVSKNADNDQTYGFAASSAKVMWSSFRDLISVAEKISEGYENRPIDIQDIEKIKECLARLRTQKQHVDEFFILFDQEKGKDNGDVEKILNALEPLEKQAHELNLDDHVKRLLGEKTVEHLTSRSKNAIAASELIYRLSKEFNDLRRDLTGAMIGYWKASEIEGRRIISELLSKKFEVFYYPKGNKTEISKKKIDEITLGTLRLIFKKLNIEPKEKDPHLPSQQLAELLKDVTFTDRNKASHTSVINNYAQLEAARIRMGCKNPTGLLPLLISSLALIKNDLDTFMPEDNAKQLPNGLICDWVGTNSTSKKGKPIFQLRGGKAHGILHPTSKIPPDIIPDQIYKMCIKTGGETYQLQWMQD